MERNELPLKPHKIRVPSYASKIIFEPMARLAQAMHLSSSETNTVTECTETRFHMSHVTEEFRRVSTKWFPSLCYVRHKPCSYLASRLALFPNGTKRASTWASSPRRMVKCIQNDFYIWRKPCTYLALTLTPSPNGSKWDLTWPTSHRSSIGCVQNDLWAYGTFGVNNAPVLRQD
jgi:hypothetical protein